MAEVSTFTELYDAGRAEIQSRNANLTDFNEGSVLDAVLGSGAMLGDEVARTLIDLFATLFFDTATGEDLDALALDRINLTRNLESSAVGTVEWKRVAAGTYPIPSGTTFQATVGDETFTFTSTTEVTVGGGDSTVNVPVQATASGRASNVAANTVTEILDTVAADPTATVTNPQPMAGGSDAETDEAFRARIRRFYSNLRRGTRGALVTGATNVNGVSFASVVEDFEGGVVFVYIGDPDAQGNDVLAALVRAELENWRAAGILVTVLSAAREEIALTLDVVVQPGSDTTTLDALIKSALVAQGDTYDPNQRAYVTEIECAARDASPLVRAATLTTPQVVNTPPSILPTLPQNAIRFVSTSITLNFTVET